MVPPGLRGIGTKFKQRNASSWLRDFSKPHIHIHRHHDQYPFIPKSGVPLGHAFLPLVAEH
jgi:hypothetical protein